MSPSLPSSPVAFSLRELGRWSLACLGLLVLVAAAYWPALGGRLIWNDPDYVTKPSLQSVHGLGRIWFEVGATEQYYPVLHSAFWLEHRLWGDAAAGYHWANVALHALAACLFALVLRRWGGFSNRAAGLAALVFAVHPVCVESVAWISEQKNTLSLVFYLAAALAYFQFEDRRRASWYAAALALFTLAVLSKSVAATLPAALCVRAWWKRGRIEPRKDLLPLAPFFLVGAAAGLFTAWVERTYIGAQGASFGLGWGQRLLLAGRIVWFYIGKLVWPDPLIFIYPRWRIDPGAWWQYGWTLAALLVTVLLWRLRSRTRAPLAAWLLFVGSLFPVLGFFNIYAFVFSYVADHWQYLPSLVAIAAACAGWGQLEKRVRQPWLRAVPWVLIAILAVASWRRARVYTDVTSLYRDTLERNPGAWLAHTNLGALLIEEGRAEEAIEHYRAAIEIVPSYPEIHGNLGDALIAAGRPQEAIAEYRAATRLNTRYVPAHVNLAHSLVAAGRPAEAAAEYEIALSLQPKEAEWEHDLGLALAGCGRPAQAETHFGNALRLRPGFPEAHNSLAILLAAEGRLPEAAAQLREAIRLRPEYTEARANLSAVAYRSGNDAANAGLLSEAIADYREALLAMPAFPEAHANLGLALAMAGHVEEALPELGEALRLKPDYGEAHAYLGFALCQEKRYTEAIAEYQEALRLRPGDPDTTYQLEAAKRAAGKP